MIQDDISIPADGRDEREKEKEKARTIARKCPGGYLVAHDRKNQRVFYKDTNSVKEIPTDFTEEHIKIAQRDLPPSDPDHLEWDRVNSEALGIDWSFYKVDGR